MSNEPQSNCAAPPHHEQLQSAISMLDETYERADKLLQRIHGRASVAQEAVGAKSDHALTLHELLTTGPDIISEKIKMIEGVIGEIESSIF